MGYFHILGNQYHVKCL